MNDTAHTFDLARFASRVQVEKLFDADRDAMGQDATMISRGNGSYARSWYGVESADNLSGVVSCIVARGDQGTTDRVVKAQREAQDLQIPAAREIKNVLKSRRVVGQRFDLERVLANDPKPWSRFERANTQGSKIVSFYVPMGGTADRSAKEIAWSPVAAVVLADLLEAAGYRVEIWAASRARQHKGVLLSLRAKLKDAGDTLDINSIARVAHPSIFRAVYLPMRAAHWGKPTIDGGYGSTCPIDPAAFGDPEGIALPHAYSLSECLSVLKAAITRFT